MSVELLVMKRSSGKLMEENTEYEVTKGEVETGEMLSYETKFSGANEGGMLNESN